MRQTQKTTLGEILEMVPGDRDNPSWINGEFEAEIANVQTKQTRTGTPYAACTFIDPDTGTEINATFFGKKFLPDSGMVLVGGQGLQLTEYNGVPQITGSAKSTVQAIGGQDAGAPPPRAQIRAPARAPAPGRSSPPPGRQNASGAPAGGFLGVTVGMAVNNACQLALEEWKADDSAQVDSSYWRRVWDYASQILRVAQVLEKGKLAPNPRDSEGTADPEPAPARAPDPEPLAPPPRQVSRPGPGGAAFDPNEVDDESVPF